MSTFTVTNSGSLPSDHWTLTLVATATTIKFANADDADGMALHLNVTNGAAVVVDGRTHTLTHAGVAAPERVVPGSGWPLLQPGENEVTITGATGTLAHRPVYV